MLTELLLSGFLVLHGPSWHSTDSPKGQPYEWATFGAGWRVERDGWGMQAGAYRNSYADLSLYGGVAVGGRIGVFAGFASGYVRNNVVPMGGVYADIGQFTVRVMPLIHVQQNRATFNGVVLTTEYVFK